MIVEGSGTPGGAVASVADAERTPDRAWLMVTVNLPGGVRAKAPNVAAPGVKIPEKLTVREMLGIKLFTSTLETEKVPYAGLPKTKVPAAAVFSTLVKAPAVPK